MNEQFKQNISIPRPPFTGIGKKLESATRKALYEYKMVDETQNIAVALSGGKDSLSLLFLLKAISAKGFPPFNLSAIHVSGEFSCGASVQKSYLQSICDQLEIPLIIKESHQKKETLECYSCSRERRTLLFSAAKEVGAKLVAFGHHADDNAQTLLMNLFHKGEFAGNLPVLKMINYDITIIRPLIFLLEKEIIAFAKYYGFARITCQCPVGQLSMRKKVDQLLTELEELFPNVRENVSQAGLLYGSDKAKQISKEIK